MNILHPPFVHFVIALPVVALFSQITYLNNRDLAYSKATFRIIAMAMLASFFAVYSGISDAQNIVDAKQLSKVGFDILSDHKTLGIIIVALLTLTTIIKWLAVKKTSHALEITSAFLIIFIVGTSLYQGRQGGMIVYKYGGGVEAKLSTNKVK